ncbi:helix-turn-helix domain-containing protein [Gordonia aurantiaca]|uniref:helix-turn-helix domain-containing protein n=1 Tax=Gordonia sp. B21 TaxID=3151852 RepID=UPI00326383C6
MSELFDDATEFGIPKPVVNSWRSRIGADRNEGRAKPLRLSGPEGMENYSPFTEMHVDDPEKFDSFMYLRKLSTVLPFCALHTPFELTRTPELVVKEPSDHLIIAVHTMKGRHTVRQGSRDFAYRPGQLAFLSNASPYVERTAEINDPAGLFIPLELLGPQRRIAEQARRPVASHTLLARATASFILRFAADTAVEVSEATEETEMAAIELVRAALGQLDYENRPITDNALFVHEAVADLIERHHRDPSFAPNTLARLLHISRRQLYRHFEDTEDSLAARIAERRLKTACELLRTRPDLSIADVARHSGFPSSPTMRNRFRAEFGCGPSEYRARANAEEGVIHLDHSRSR